MCVSVGSRVTDYICLSLKRITMTKKAYSGDKLYLFLAAVARVILTFCHKSLPVVGLRYGGLTEFVIAFQPTKVV